MLRRSCAAFAASRTRSSSSCRYLSNSATTWRGLSRLPSADQRSTTRATWRISSTSSSIAASMPGRSTLTATSRPSFRTAKCTCAIDALATGSASKLAKIAPSGRPNAFSTIARATSAGNGGTPVLQARELVGDVGRQQVAPRRQHLAELDEDRAEPLQAEAQAHAARRVEAAADRDDANEKTDPALAKARERQLVEAVAKNRDADDDETGEVPHQRGGVAAGFRVARSRSVFAPSRRAPANQPPTLASWRAGPSPITRARSSCRSQRRLSISQSMSLAKAASPETVTAGRSPATIRVSASAGFAASTATRRSGAGEEASGSHSTSPAGETRNANGPTAGRRRRPAAELDLQGPRRVRTQALERRRLGGDHVIDQENEPLHHGALGQRFDRFEHAGIVGTHPAKGPRAAGLEGARPAGCRTIAASSAALP